MPLFYTEVLMRFPQQNERESALDGNSSPRHAHHKEKKRPKKEDHRMQDNFVLKKKKEKKKKRTKLAVQDMPGKGKTNNKQQKRK